MLSVNCTLACCPGLELTDVLKAQWIFQIIQLRSHNTICMTSHAHLTQADLSGTLPEHMHMTMIANHAYRSTLDTPQGARKMLTCPRPHEEVIPYMLHVHTPMHILQATNRGISLEALVVRTPNEAPDIHTTYSLVDSGCLGASNQAQAPTNTVNHPHLPHTT